MKSGRTGIKLSIIIAYGLACGLNLLVFLDRPGDPTDFVSAGWLFIITVGPVTLVAFISGLVALYKKKCSTQASKYALYFLLSTPLLSIGLFLLLAAAIL